MSAGAVRAPLVIPLRPPVPGVPKSHIDTNTRLELMSETPNVDIYFTINGNKPRIEKNDKALMKTGTYKFRTPFTLPPGAQIVRAIAFLPETGGESNVVTKKFDVAKSSAVETEGNVPLPDDYGFLEDWKAIESHRKTHSSDGLKRSPSGDHLRKPPSRDADQSKLRSKRRGEFKDFEEPDFNESKSPGSKGLEPLKTMGSNEDLIRPFDVALPKRPMAPTLPDPSAQFTRLQRVTDVLHCPHCFNQRPATEAQNFCVHCGHSLPPLPTPHALDSGIKKLGHCASCGSNIPLNFPTCPVCENRLRSTSKHETAQEYRLCTVCGTLNPAHITSCLTCEARIDLGRQNLICPSHQLHPSRSPTVMTSVLSEKLNSPRQQNGIRLLSCPHCQRQNLSDARFCDRCGLETIGLVRATHQESQPSPKWAATSFFPKEEKTISNSTFLHPGYFPSGDAVILPYSSSNGVTSMNQINQCVRCGNGLIQDASFCSRCGSYLEPPTRDSIWKSFGPSPFDTYNPSLQTNRKHTSFSNAATQTVGLFYPSAADLRRKELLTRSQSDVSQIRERTPLLKAISPGRGFWRKQLDHIISHLKVYTNNNPEFRVAIGEPRMGKLLSANLVETSGCATVTLVYSLPQSDSNDTPVSVLRQRGGSASSGDSRHRTNKLIRNSACSDQKIPVPFEQFSVQSEDDSQNEPSTPRRSDTDSVYQKCLTRKYAEYKDSQETAVGSESTREGIPSPSLDGVNSSDLEVENVEPLQPYQRPDSTSKKKGVRTSNDSAPRAGSKSRHFSGNQSVNLDKKATAPRSTKKATEITLHHGEAGVALLRQSKLTTLDRNLIQHLSNPDDEPNEDDVRRLLDEGANANCTDADGRTPLLLAVLSRRVGAIPILIEAGAKLNSVVPSTGNTALHEAVLCGLDGVDLVDTLLRYGANPKIKNKRQETPHSLALRLNCEPISRLFLTHMGQLQLQRLTEETTRSNVDSPEVDNL